MDIDALAQESLNHPNNFAYFGDREGMFVTWGYAHIATLTRDSGPLDESNHHTIYSDLLGRFPADIDCEKSSHWAVGWVEEIVVRVLDDAGDITDAFRAVCDWREKLENYPVADDEDYSEREYDVLIETLTQCYDIPSDDASEFASYAEYMNSEELRDEQVRSDYEWFIAEAEVKAMQNDGQLSLKG